MANPLRADVLKKYGAGGSSSASTGTPTAGSTRAAILAKYKTAPATPAQKSSNLSSYGIKSTTNLLNPNPPTPATKTPVAKTVSKPLSTRESIVSKYNTPTPDSPAGKVLAAEKAKQQEATVAANGTISSPEYFANSVDVRSTSGKFLKTFTGKKPGEAKALAEAYAKDNEGYIQVTPPGGFFGKMFVRAQDALKGALDNLNQKAQGFSNEVMGIKPDPNGGPTMVPDTTAGPVSRGASSVDLGVAGLSVLLSPISAAFAAAEEVPVAGVGFQGINYIFGKVGEAGGWAAGKAVDHLPISDQAKADIKPAAESLSSLLAQIAAGKVAGKPVESALKKTEALRTEIKQKVTKDIIETNQLPRNVYISPDAVKSIFGNGEKISAEELDMITSLGLDGKGYRDAIKNGVSIQIPGEKIVTVMDKPWFAKAKAIFGIEPTSSTFVDVNGKMTQNKTVTEAPALPAGKTGESIPGAIEPVNTVAQRVLTEPITPTLLDQINALTPEENSAFGKKVVESINNALGIQIDAAKADLPGNIKIIPTESGDGRPAQFKNGEIQLFMPNVLKDIQTLASGGKILAHDGEFSTVYHQVPGESMEELSTRYVRDIILHEAAHQKTLTLDDQNTINRMMSELNQAKISGNEKGVITARESLNKFMKSLEDKANAYMRDNRDALEKEFLGGKQKETQTAMQRRISKTTEGKIPSRNIVKTTEKKLLKDRIKAQAKGARAGFSEGKKVGSEKTAEIKKTQHQTAIDKINDRAATVASRKQAAIDYAKILPFRERGKFLKAINNISSQKEFLNVIERMSKASRAAERKVLISKISEELKGTVVKKVNGAPKTRFDIEAQRTLNEMRRLQKTMTYQEAQMAIADKISAWQTENPDSAIPTELLREVEILKTVGIKEQTVNELSDTLSAIQSLKETGRTKKELELFNRDTEIQRKKDKIFDIITGGKPLPSDKLSVKTRERKGGIKQSVKEFLTMQQYGFEEVLDVFSINDKTSAPYESFLSKWAGDKVNDAFNTQNRGELQQIDGISTTMKDVYGLKTNTEVMSTLGDLKEVEILGEYKHADGVTRILELSRGEAMQYYMWMQDEALTSTFTETLNWTPEIMKAVTDFLKPEDIKMADTLINEFYPKYYESINAVYSKEYGVDLPFNSNYSPVHRAVDATIPENVLLAQESAKYATAKNGSLKDRQKSIIDLKATDAFENVMRHITKMEHYKAWSESMFEFRRVFSDKQIRQAITDVHGKGYMKVMDNFLNDFARDGVAREKIVKAVDQLRMNVTKALLGLNYKVGIKQLTGVLNYGIEIPTKDLTVGLADYWRDPLGHARFLHDKSATLQERFGDGFERDIKYAIQKGYDKKLAKANNLSEVYFVITRNADKFTVYQGAWAVYRSRYNEAKRAGKTDAQAEAIGIRAAENITNRIQESSRLDTLSPLQRGGSIAKLFTMLAGQPNKYLRVMNNAGRNWKAGRQSGSVAARRILWTWFVVPFFYNLVADQLIDEKYRESTGGLVTKTLLGPLSYPLVIGQLWQQMYGWTQGENFSYQASPVESLATDIQKSIANWNSDDMVDAITYIIDAIGKLTGVPTTIVTKPVRNANKDAASGGSGSVSF